jgi:hypothetical protein
MDSNKDDSTEDVKEIIEIMDIIKIVLIHFTNHLKQK